MVVKSRDFKFNKLTTKLADSNKKFVRARFRYDGSLPMRNSKLSVASCQLRVASCQLRVASCQLISVSCQLVSVSCYFASDKYFVYCWPNSHVLRH